MNIIKQFLLYGEIKELESEAIRQTSGIGLQNGYPSSHTTYLIKSPGVYMNVSRIMTETGACQRVSYALSIQNKHGLRHVPQFYANDSMLARKVYNMYKDRMQSALPISVIRIR